MRIDPEHQRCPAVYMKWNDEAMRRRICSSSDPAKAFIGAMMLGWCPEPPKFMPDDFVLLKRGKNG